MKTENLTTLEDKYMWALEQIQLQEPGSEEIKWYVSLANVLHKQLEESTKNAIADAKVKLELEIKSREVKVKEDQYALDAGQRYHNDDMDFRRIHLEEEELKLKQQQQKDSKKDRIIKTVLDSAAIIIPTGCSCYWMAKGMKFEESGMFTSKTAQWLSNHFRLFKK